MAKAETRIGALQAFLLIGGIALLGRAGYLQLVKGGAYSKKAAAERTVRKELEAPRGTISDRTGTPLAISFEKYHLEIAPEQVRKVDSLLRVYRSDVGRIDRLRTSLGDSEYFYAHGPFSATQVRRLRGFRGVRLIPLYRREYPSGPLARPLIGALSSDGPGGASGLERFLDSLLAGLPGETVFLKDARGRLYESPGRLVRAPTPGLDVTLTIDKELQEIAEGALREAFASYEPRRGDIVFLDPRSGEVLAAASRERDSLGREIASASFFLSAFEPGSTAKPFTAAALLELARVDSTEVVSGEGGKWVFEAAGGKPRTVTDDHPQHVPITLARAIQVSSNIGMVKFSRKLKPAEHYDLLRAFGFGSPTGVEFSVESPGILERPNQWRDGWQGPSMAMGYGFQVTPIQLAAAYGAIANGGRLMAPAVIREVKDRGGTVRYRHTPLVVRQAISPDVAARIRYFLSLAAADSGTGSRAQVKGGVLGKTGTAKLVVNRRYTNRHAASFAGIFPAKDPQLVVVVRVEDPKGDYYGGLVAAPLVARMLRQALSARGTAIDRARLADQTVEPSRKAGDSTEARPVPVTWTAIPVTRSDPVPPAMAVVPDVTSLDVRAAASQLHRRGFRVRLEGAGWVKSTTPEAGDSLGVGQTVVVTAGPEHRP